MKRLAFLVVALITVSAHATPTRSLNVNGIKFPDGTNAPGGYYNVKAPEYNADSTDATDATAAIQAAINAASGSTAGGGVVLLPGGTYKISSAAGLVLKSGVSFIGQSSLTTVLDCKYTAVNCISIAAGTVANVHVQGLRLMGDYTNATANSVKQRGMLLLAQDSGGVGGLWSSDFSDIQINNFTGEGIWLRANLNDFLHPNQFLIFSNVQINAQASSTRGTSCYVTPEAIDPTHANGTGPCYLLRMTGQVDQVTFINGQVNGPTGNGTNVYIGYEVANTETATPQVINFQGGWTCQQADTCAYVNWGYDVHFDGDWFETLNRGLKFASSRVDSVTANHFANATSDGASGGYAVLADQNASYVIAERNQISGTVDADFTATNGATVITRGNNNNTTGAKPSGNTVQVGPSGTITSYGYKTLLVNGGSSITTINSQLGVGETITIYSFGVGGITLNSGGNISFGTLAAPLTVVKDGVVTLTRFDLGATWTITSKIP